MTTPFASSSSCSRHTPSGKGKAGDAPPVLSRSVDASISCYGKQFHTNLAGALTRQSGKTPPPFFSSQLSTKVVFIKNSANKGVADVI